MLRSPPCGGPQAQRSSEPNFREDFFAVLPKKHQADISLQGTAWKTWTAMTPKDAQKRGKELMRLGSGKAGRGPMPAGENTRGGRLLRRNPGGAPCALQTLSYGFNVVIAGLRAIQGLFTLSVS
ncbi:hypothetical protein C8R31_10587 [Nitrosospira sp. Nsp2]|nr:hypothetical protein C8R31_10587 [Nitrosospira sp. Nsp2]